MLIYLFICVSTQRVCVRVVICLRPCTWARVKVLRSISRCACRARRQANQHTAWLERALWHVVLYYVNTLEVCYMVVRYLIVLYVTHHAVVCSSKPAHSQANKHVSMKARKYTTCLFESKQASTQPSTKNTWTWKHASAGTRNHASN